MIMFWTNAVTGVKFPACTCVRQNALMSPFIPFGAGSTTSVMNGNTWSIREQVLACCRHLFAQYRTQDAP